MNRYEIRRQRLLQLRDEWCDGKTVVLAGKIGRDESYVSRMLYPEGKEGKKNIGEQMVSVIQRAFSLPNGWMDTEPGTDLSPNTLPGPALRGRVPLISWVQAGDWSEVIDNLQPGEGERIETTYRASANAYALRVRGDSMESKFPAGAILIVEPNENPEPGKYVIVRQNGDTEATFKQLVQDGGTMYLKPLNDRYPIMMLRPDAVFCGVVKRMEMDV